MGRKHPDKELRALIDAALAHGWRIDRSTTYYILLCGCGQHRKTVHMTPSDPNYILNTTKWFHRTCWKETP